MILCSTFIPLVCFVCCSRQNLDVALCRLLMHDKAKLCNTADWTVTDVLFYHSFQDKHCSSVCTACFFWLCQLQSVWRSLDDGSLHKRTCSHFRDNPCGLLQRGTCWLIQVWNGRRMLQHALSLARTRTTMDWCSFALAWYGKVGHCEIPWCLHNKVPQY